MTLDPRFYRDPAWFEQQLERIFVPSWQVVLAQVQGEHNIVPFELIPGSLDEPLILVREEDQTRILSNVCTHRANILVDAPCSKRKLRCGYHGRRYALDGSVEASPGFSPDTREALAQANLPALPVEHWGPLTFTSLRSSGGFEAIRQMLSPADVLPLDAAHPAETHRFDLDVHWALYVENYLESLHVPFVHPGLQAELSDVQVEVFEAGSLQRGLARGDAVLPLPEDHPEARDDVAAWYFFVFPNTMINVYPWGISLNVVLPRGPQRTRVLFRYYVWDEARRAAGAGGDLLGVEMEDEAIVSRVQRGMRSRLWRQGDLCPAEAAVADFQRRCAAVLQ